MNIQLLAFLPFGGMAITHARPLFFGGACIIEVSSQTHTPLELTPAYRDLLPLATHRVTKKDIPSLIVLLYAFSGDPLLILFALTASQNCLLGRELRQEPSSSHILTPAYVGACHTVSHNAAVFAVHRPCSRDRATSAMRQILRCSRYSQEVLHASVHGVVVPVDERWALHGTPTGTLSQRQ